MILETSNEFISYWLNSSIKNLKKRQNVINIINLFPVADSDTGNNIVMTLDDAFNKSYIYKNKLNLKDYSAIVSNNLLISARGNSGIIVSEIVSSVCEVISEKPYITNELLAEALELANLKARQAIAHPVDGTILDITRSAHESVRKNLTKDLNECLDNLSKDIKDSLANTSSVMHILNKAGVVDSGAYALVIIYESLIDTIRDTEREPLSIQVPDSMKKNRLNNKISASIPYQYEIMFNCNNHDDVEKLKKIISEISNDLIISKSESMYGVHLHTYELAECIEAIYNSVSPFNLKIHVISIY